MKWLFFFKKKGEIINENSTASIVCSFDNLEQASLFYKHSLVILNKYRHKDPSKSFGDTFHTGEKVEDFVRANQKELYELFEKANNRNNNKETTKKNSKKNIKKPSF